MQRNKTFPEIILLMTLLLSGFYGGVGFFTVISNNPAIQHLKDAAFAEYWQHLDSFMANRMRIFGPCLLLSVMGSLIVLYRNYSRSSFLLMLAALCIILVDLFIGITVNHPLNQLIQSWDLNALPANVSDIRNQVVAAFWLRATCMISSFVLVILAFWKRF
ncbi:MAG TPA: hypothetical protein VF691_21145 [Cytophagaceae bacterium]